MATVLRTQVVQSVQNNIKRPKPRHVELRVFYVGVDRVDSDVGVECGGGMCRNLSIPVFLSIATYMRPMDHTKALLCFTSFLRKRN